MATRPAASRLIVLLFVLRFLIFIQFVSAGETNVRAEPGQKVTLPCRAAENKPVIVLEWSKPDLGENHHVALYRDDRLNYRELNPAYKDRVDLQDREMKNGDVSLVLRNVTTDDAGMYECRVDGIKNKRRKRSHLKTEPICNVILDVSAPGNKEKQKMDGGNEEGQKKGGGNEEGQKKDGGTSTGVIAGVSVLVVLALFPGIGFWLYKKLSRSPQEQNQPPAAEAELQAMNVGNHPEAEM